MSELVYVSKSRLERKKGPVRVAQIAGEPQPVVLSVHGAIAEHYKVNPASPREGHWAPPTSATYESGEIYRNS